MSQPRREDEVALFRELRAQLPVPYHGIGGTEMIALWQRLGIAPNRGEYLLQKWTDKGWWDYGMWAKGGWFTETAPMELPK